MLRALSTPHSERRFSAVLVARVGLLLLAVAAHLIPVRAHAQADDFTLIALPDTQFYTCTSGGSCASGLGIYDDQTDWIAANRDTLDIRFVTQLGDCAQNGNVTAEYDIAEAAFETLEMATGAGYPDGVPYGIAVGNHDQFPIMDPGSIPTILDVNHPNQATTTTTFNAYFGVDRFCPLSVCRNYYGDHFGINNDNHYELFSANGYDFIILHIEYMSSDTALRQAVIAWADGVLTTYSDRRAIVVSHHVLESGFDAAFSNQGSAIYEGLKNHPNLFLILGGHVHAEGQRTDTYNGNTVHTILADYQGRTNGGDGWLRILEFQPSLNQISVKTYSPYLDSYETDADSEFTLQYDMQGGYPSASVETFQQGAGSYTGAVDTFIEFGAGAHGSEQKFFWDNDPAERFGLLRFDDLFDTDGGPIPAGAFITSATLRYVADDNGNDGDVHEVTIPWAESADYAGFGINPGAQPDEDYDSAMIAQASGSAPGDTRTEHVIDVTASVAAWSADPSANHGWIFVPTGPSGVGVRSSDYTTDPADRPLLTVSYLAIPCTLDSECDDSSVCTTDTCVDDYCQNVATPGCCEVDGDCVDANSCTVDSCDLGSNTCENVATPGCCAVDTDCDDADSCTADACVQPNLAALVLDGTGDWLSFGDAITHTELGLATFTLEGWFRRTGTGDNVSTGTGGIDAFPLIAKGRGEEDGTTKDANYFLGIQNGTNVLAADFEDTGGSPNNHPVTGTTPIVNGTWYHGAVTFDGNDLKLYLNGVLDGSVATTATPRFDSIQPFSIGTAMTSTNAADGAFAGELDEVRVWNRALSQAEILAGMNVPIPSDPDLVGRWSMDEGSGATAADSVNANDGTLVGNAGWTTSGLVSLGDGSCQSTAIETCCELDTDCDDLDLCSLDVCHIVPSLGVLTFDGSNDYATRGEPSTLGSNTFTIEGWIYWNGTGAPANAGTGGVTAGIPIITKGRGEADDAVNGTNLDANYFLAIDDATHTLAADFEAAADSSNHPIFGSTVITTNVWHHVAATYDGSDWNLYLDGNLDATGFSGATPRGDSIQHFGIGAAFNSTGVAAGAFGGQIHDVRVWDHARSEVEIQADMNMVVTSASGLLGSFVLDEGTGTSAGDSTGNGNDAAISGASWSMEADTCVSGPSQCEMVMYQDGVDGYAGTVDTYIEVSTGAHGTEDHLFWDGSPERFGLLRFEDLFESEGGLVPDGATIGLAQLTYVLDDNGNDGSIHEVLIDWTESVDYAGFGVSGGAQSGTDYDATALADPAPGTLVGSETAYTIDVTDSITAWLADPSSNKGWIIVPTGTSGVGIRTREHATVDHRPKLTVHYLPEPSQLLMLASGSVGLALGAWRRRSTGR